MKKQRVGAAAGWGGGMFHGKPILGIVGGIGSGKSFVAGLFGELGAVVIDSDKLVHAAYARPEIRAVLRDWWGDAVFLPGGELNRRAVAARIFGNDAQRLRLERFIHPIVTEDRDRMMAAEAATPGNIAFVWDTPLLLETGANDRCDAVVFVDTPLEVRTGRVATRGWTTADLAARENLQLPLDKKRLLADYVVSNAADAKFAREQVSTILSSIIAKVNAARMR